MERRSSDCGLFVRQNLFCHFAPSEYTSSIIVYSSNLMNEFDPYFDRASTANRIPPQQAEEQPAATAPWRKLLQETVQVVLPALALALVVHLFLAQATIVYGQSMEPNLLERQRLIIDKISFRLHPPQRDIVVSTRPAWRRCRQTHHRSARRTVEIHQALFIDGDPCLSLPARQRTPTCRRLRWGRSATLCLAITTIATTAAPGPLRNTS